jgi:signal transduction histidine kinase
MEPISVFFRRIFSEFIFTTDEKPSGYISLKESNYSRLEYLFYLGIPVSLVHIAIFFFSKEGSSVVEEEWRAGIINAHVSLAVLFLVFGVSSIIINIKKQQTTIAGRLIPHFVFFTVIIAGAVISGIDQLVTPAINPFVVTVILVAMFIYIHPFASMVYYLLGYLIFYFFQNRFQDNQQILLSNMVNGFTIISVGWFLSITFWRNFIFRFRKEKIIETQKNELSIHNQVLTAHTAELKAVNRTKDKLFSIVSHDLRGPLANLSSMIHLIKNDDISKEEFTDLLPELYRQTLLSNDLLENLLSWSKNNLKNSVANPEEVSLKEISEEVIQLYKTQIEAKNLIIENKVNDSHYAYADKEMIPIVLRNLTSNAIKFSNSGGSVVIESKKINGNIEFSITDTGKGISDEQIKMVLSNEYYSTPGTAGEKGNGLGLLLCREFVEKNGGKLSISGSLGKGSRFSFTIPVKEKTNGVK